jgi:hypothetical protein
MARTPVTKFSEAGAVIVQVVFGFGGQLSFPPRVENLLKSHSRIAFEFKSFFPHLGCALLFSRLIRHGSASLTQHV